MQLLLRRNKYIIILLSVLMLFISASFGETDNQTNLVFNGDFEQTDPDGNPEGWYEDAYFSTKGFTMFRIVRDPEHGNVIEITNLAQNDARFAQSIAVEPETVYCLSGYIRADGIEDGRGANLSVEGIYAFSESVYDSDGEWIYIEYYGETGPDQRNITVYARVGGYGGESSGKACFDQICLKQAENIPDDVIADRWYSIAYNDPEDDTDNDAGQHDNGWKSRILFLAVSFLWLVILLAVLYYYRDGSDKKDLSRPAARKGRFLVFLLISFLMRNFISYFVYGYEVDVNCFLSWGHTMAMWGPAQFYQKTGFCDYPPLYTYILGLNSLLSPASDIQNAWTRVIFRFLPSLCDVAACWILAEYAQRKKTENISFVYTMLAVISFNPATILNSSAWGQMDSVLCLVIMMVALCAIEGKWQAAIPLYAVSILIKPQALMLGFLGLAFIIITWIREPDSRKKIIIGVGIAVAAILIGIIPFGIRQEFGWLVNQYIKTLQSYPHPTVNTANIYYVLGGNWGNLESSAHIAAPVLFGTVTLLYGIMCIRNSRKTKNYLIEGILSFVFSGWFIYCAAFGTNWVYIGSASMAFAFLITISLGIRSGNIRLLPYLGALLFILLYVFGIKMHERYLFPAVFLLAAAWIVLKDRRILYLLGLFSITLFINEGIVLDNSIRLGAQSGHLMPDTVVLAVTVSLINIFSAFYAVILGHSIAAGTVPVGMWRLKSFLPVKIVPHGRLADSYHPDPGLHWSIKDTLILISVTAIYSLISLTTLGSAKAPQTAWSSSGYDEEIVFDLGNEYDDFRILYFGQVSRYDFSLAQSSDGVSWENEVYAQMDQGQCWKWKYVTQSNVNNEGTRVYYNTEQYVIHFRGRYIRLTAEQIGLTLNEIVFRDSEGNTIPATILSRSNGIEDSELYSDPNLLLDEPDTMEPLPVLFAGPDQLQQETQPSWWNSTYFDEIYHARTGYEFLHQEAPYETSHPPLGKVLISLCISIFGMTPFGWRFAGAMAGILMLPGMYLLAKQLTKKTGIATIVCLLMALDCMHLTQTQIATIDSFPVLFIIFAYYFMLRYMQTDIIHEPIRKSLILLLFSGIMMGLAIASKWIGIYAGAGLAVLFFWHGYRSIRIARNNGAGSPDNPEGNSPDSGPGSYSDISFASKRLMIICAWCILFFIIIPVSVYLISYIPYMAYDHRIRSFGEYLTSVWQSQLGMLSYHSTPGLGMDHPFYSPWYEWPVIGKPMFYATEQYISSASTTHHSIFCFGNPVVWWGGLGALLICLIRWIAGKRYQIENHEERWHWINRNYDIQYAFVMIALAAQYLPWVPVPRGTYIYHYFASVPFLILGIGLCYSEIYEKHRKAAVILASLGVILAAACFVIFFPYASGIAVPSAWLNIGKMLLHIYY